MLDKRKCYYVNKQHKNSSNYLPHILKLIYYY